MAVRPAWVVQRLPAASMVSRESTSSTIGHITLGMKQTGKPSAGNPHAGFDVAGAGNGFTVRLVRHSQRKRGATDRPDLRNTAPVLDPTGKGHLKGATLDLLLRSSLRRQGGSILLVPSPLCE